MKSHTFKGGIHPPERKELTEHLPIETVFPFTNSVSIPATQGGAPNTVLVKAGDTVIRGQKIAESDAFMSAPVHASITGTVKKIEFRAVTGNIDAPCIVIEGSGSDETAFMESLDPFTCSKEEALKRIKDAGIVGMGGAAFPTHVKLNPPKGKVIEHVLANAAECEPYLTIDERTMTENTDTLVDGVAITIKVTGAKSGLIVLEDNKSHLVSTLQTAITKSGYTNINVVLVKTKYPQGGEKNIVKSALKKEIPSGGLPADIGCVIVNVGTLCAISDAFRLGKPLIDRGLTVSGGACASPKNLRVPVGTLVGDLIPSVIKLNPGIVKILSGGPMMGVAMANANFPIAKNTSGVLFLTAKETDLREENQCINCGKCVTVCSCRLYPVMIAKELEAGNLENAKKYGLMDCVECGTCSYVCPAHIQLVQRFRVGKQLFRIDMQKKQQKAEALKAKTAELQGGK